MICSISELGAAAEVAALALVGCLELQDTPISTVDGAEYSLLITVFVQHEPDLMLSMRCSVSILMSTKMYMQGTLVTSTGTKQLWP